MTIKPKKKLNKDKPDPENTDVHSHSSVHPHPHTHGLGHNHPHVHNHYHHTHASGNESRLEKPPRVGVRSSPTRWLPSTSAHGHDEYGHTVSHGHSNLAPGLSASATFEPHDVPSNHKRRHRSSPHRTVRKHHRNHTPNVNAAPSVGVTTNNNSSLVSLADNEEDCDDDYTGYNSEDEHSQPPTVPENLSELEKWFEESLAEKKGFRIKKMGEDGACLFRAVADQVYGDQEMHGVVRKRCLDYMAKNAEFYSQYVTEDFNTYINRKRMDSCHGNHLEIQAMTELFNRPVEVYQYSLDPMNTFDTARKSDIPPIRLSYHGNVHYNSIVDPYTATIGVGLGLPGFQPGLAERTLMTDAMKNSENFHIEQTMLEDKIRETDWEVTQDSIDEQVARESYLQWLREQEKASRRTKGNSRSASATSSSAAASESGNHSGFVETGGPVRSPRQLRSGNNSPLHQTLVKEDQFVPLPGSSKSPCHSPQQALAGGSSASGNSKSLIGGASVDFDQPTSMDTNLNPTLYGLSDWGEEDILAQVMAQSQQEYLDNLRKKASSSSSGSAGSSPGQSPPHQSSSSSSSYPTTTSHEDNDDNSNNVNNDAAVAANTGRVQDNSNTSRLMMEVVAGCSNAGGAGCSAAATGATASTSSTTTPSSPPLSSLSSPSSLSSLSSSSSATASSSHRHNNNNNAKRDKDCSPSSYKTVS